MRNSLSAVRPAAVSKPGSLGATPRRSIAELLVPVERIAAHSPNIIVNRDARFEVDGESYVLPQYLFIGPKSGDAPIRVGIFAAIHGDELEGAFAAVRFLQYLENYADLAAGYCLSVYPVCNPTGFEDNTRHSRRGKDLNREFWSKSGEPEVGLLQAELVSRSFHGIISLHVDDTSDGFYGIVGAATLTKHLIGPALKAAEAFLPLDDRALIDGFPARQSGRSRILSRRAQRPADCPAAPVRNHTGGAQGPVGILDRVRFCGRLAIHPGRLPQVHCLRAEPLIPTRNLPSSRERGLNKTFFGTDLSSGSSAMKKQN